MRFRRAQEPFLCDLLYVDRVQSRQQIPLGVSTLLVELQDGYVEMLMRRECQAVQNHWLQYVSCMCGNRMSPNNTKLILKTEAGHS